MSILYPASIDTFGVPDEPEGTPLSQAGTSSRNHTENHGSIGQAITALETYKAERAHDHSGDSADRFKGAKLLQANTHQSPDTDVAISSLHHTIDPTAASATKAAASNHTHDWNASPSKILNRPYIICTSSTRPSSPFAGLTIFETDTNATRMWMDPPGATGFIWQLIPTTVIPILRAESRATQEITPYQDHICWFTDLIEAILFPASDFVNISNTDVHITEPGLYHVNTRWHWDPANTWHDQSLVSITVNGQDIGRKDWRFLRGYSYVPGFGQSHDIGFWWRFNAGDVLRVMVRINGNRPSFLWWNPAPPDKQVNHLELIFHSP